jgi:hypothetical protein
MVEETIEGERCVTPEEGRIMGLDIEDEYDLPGYTE